MADVHDKATRSKNMRAIGTRDTAIENGWLGYWQAPDSLYVQDAALPGRPDFVMADYRALSLPTAASGIIMTAICLKSRHPNRVLAG
jgi:G:T-mismatch repair DNA endonuclease (very short patch repair protein)